MTDRALDNAIARRDGLAALINSAQQQIDEWRRELRRAESFIAEWHAFAEREEPPHHEDFEHPVPEAPPSRSEDDYGAVRKRTTGNSKKEEVASAARAFIEETGAPVSRDDLFKQMIAEGLTIEGTDPIMVMTTMLWRMRDKAAIVRLKNGGYWLKERPYEPAGYYPNDIFGDDNAIDQTPYEETDSE